ncbi:MAG: hypothetical protein AAF495_05040 [Pseudomonadota bacterium]
MPNLQIEHREALAKAFAEATENQLENEKIAEPLNSLDDMPFAFNAEGYLHNYLVYSSVRLSRTSILPSGPFFSGHAGGVLVPYFGSVSGDVYANNVPVRLVNDTQRVIITGRLSHLLLAFFDSGWSPTGYFKSESGLPVNIGETVGYGVWSSVAPLIIPLPDGIDFENADFRTNAHTLWGTGNDGSTYWGWRNGAFLDVLNPTQDPKTGKWQVTAIAKDPGWHTHEDLAFVARYQLGNEEKTPGVFAAMRIGGESAAWSTTTATSGANIPLPSGTNFDKANFKDQAGHALWGTGDNGKHLWGFQGGGGLWISNPTRSNEQEPWHISATAEDPAPSPGEQLALILRYNLGNQKQTPGVFAAMWNAT